MNIIDANLDQTQFNRMFQDLGDVVDQDGEEFLRDETARLAEECARQLSSRGENNKGQLSKDIRSVFAPLPAKMLPEKHRHGNGMVWLAAGPSYLIGVKPLRYHDTDSVEDMRHLFYKSKGHLPVDRRVELGVKETHGWDFKKHAAHGGQHVYEMQRLMVKRGAYKQFQALLKSHFGRLEASFADTARILRGGGAKVRAYVSRHFPSKTNITDQAGLANKGYPKMEFGSIAPGVENFEPYIDAALAVRTQKMMMRYNLILNGYDKDLVKSNSPRRQAKTVSGIE